MRRHSTRHLPAYRHLPGRTPHPRASPAGHSRGLPEWRPEALVPERWPESEAWRYAVDLFNHAYWWEAHEVLEGLWRAAGPATREGLILQGLIQVAAGCLKREVGATEGAARLFAKGLDKLRLAPDSWCGLSVRAFEESAAAFAGGRVAAPPAMDLEGC